MILLPLTATGKIRGDTFNFHHAPLVIVMFITTGMTTIRSISITALLLWGAALTPATGEPTKAKGKFTLYYVAEVEAATSGGSSGKVQLTDGTWETYRMSPKNNRRANMEGTVASFDKDGKRYISSIIKIGRWHDLPDHWHGKGNRDNPLHPYRSVAADQRHHPYGSHLFIEELVGYETPNGTILDGHFWVGDVGGGIKGLYRFDLFVGEQKDYLTHMDNAEGKWRSEIVINHPPKIGGKFNPKTFDGVHHILIAHGYLDKETEASNLAAHVKALTEFQKAHHHIEPTEYGTRKGSVTYWYLSQAAVAARDDKPYQAPEKTKPKSAPESAEPTGNDGE